MRSIERILREFRIPVTVFWLSTIMRYYIQPIARKLGIAKRVGWHTFRHTFSTLLKANGEDVKVVQELLRHATTRDDAGQPAHRR